MSDPTTDQFVEAMVILARAGIPTDVQELLFRGDPERGIKPNALYDCLATQSAEITKLKAALAEEKARADRMANDWFEFCEAIGVDPDTQEAVAYELNAKIGNAEADIAEVTKERDEVEGARAEQWRLRREAEASRDVALAVATTFRAERDGMAKALEEMRPHVEKIVACVRLNDEWGRVVTGQTEAAKALGEIFAALSAHRGGEDKREENAG